MRMRRIGIGRKKNGESGMSLLEVMIAGVVLLAGMCLGVLPMISYGVITMRATDEETIAKQKAREVMESIYGARDSSQLGWDTINPTSVCTTTGTTTTCGIFLSTAQPMYAAGADGIYGTGDDAAAGIETVSMANGQTRTLDEFKRTITIGSYTMPDGTISPSLRTLEVDITYPVGGLKKTYSVYSLISQYK